MAETTSATARWNTLEQQSSTMFFVGGVLWLLDTGLLSLELFAGISLLGTPGMVNPLLYVSGLVVAIVGLLGLYPGLADRTPRLARVGAGLVAIAGLTIPVLLVWFVIANLLNRPDPPFVFLLLSLLVVVLGSLLLGIASVRADVPSRTVGLLVLAVPVTLLVLVLGIVVTGGDAPSWASPAIGGVTAVLLLAIGYLLRNEGVPTDSTEPAPKEVRRG